MSEQDESTYESRTTRTINDYKWSAQEMYDLGRLLRDTGETVCSAAGRLEKFNLLSEKVHDIELPSVSTLSKGVEDICSLTWQMRNAVNSTVGVSSVDSSEVLREMRRDVTALKEARSLITDPVVTESIKQSIQQLLERILLVEIELASEDRENGYFLEKNTFQHSAVISELDSLTSLLDYFSLDPEDESGAGHLANAIDALRDGNIQQVYELLNTPRKRIESLIGNPEQQKVLDEVLASYGYRWRTDQQTRFNLPVSRFKFSQVAYRSNSERRAANLVITNRSVAKPFYNVEETISLVLNSPAMPHGDDDIITLRQFVLRILKDANKAVMFARHDDIPYDWFWRVFTLLDVYKGIMPERLWRAMLDINTSNGSEVQTCFSSNLREALAWVSKQRHKYLDGKHDEELELKPAFIVRHLHENHYLPKSTRENVDERNWAWDVDGKSGARMYELKHIVDLLTHIIFQWFSEVELKCLVQTGEYSEDVPGATVVVHSWVWPERLIKKDIQPICWNLKETHPGIICLAGQKEIDDHQLTYDYKHKDYVEKVAVKNTLPPAAN